jgi:Xaa-Pro aminopeptidase
MMFGLENQADQSVYVRRMDMLFEAIKKQYPQVKNGCIMLVAAFENSRTAFRQDSSFYYFTGITEPGVVYVRDIEGMRTLMVPRYASNRSQWVESQLDILSEEPELWGLDSIEMLGAQVPGYQMAVWAGESAYVGLCQTLKGYIEKGGSIFVLGPAFAQETNDSRIVLERLEGFVPGLHDAVIDISPLVASMRRNKDMAEVELMYSAVEVTVLAHEAGSQAIAHDVLECEVQARIEYIFTAAGARPAFPTIVASGEATTILHYTAGKNALQSGDLVIVDCGADQQYYCGDLSRTYPVSGAFSPRQKEVYGVVLELQAHIAHIVKPGFWFSNPQDPEKSLNHIAKKFLAEHGGYESYFVHGIGHFLGIDVHDMGDVLEPFAEGDIITIEPGLYLPEEKIGIRIEDNYWITKNGAICLSEALPRKPEDIELFMKGQSLLSSEEDTEEAESGLNDDCCS